MKTKLIILGLCILALSLSGCSSTDEDEFVEYGGVSCVKGCFNYEVALVKGHVLDADSLDVLYDSCRSQCSEDFAVDETGFGMVDGFHSNLVANIVDPADLEFLESLEEEA